MLDHRRPSFVWIIVFLSIAYVACLAFTIVMVASHFGLEKNPGWTVRVTGDGWFVSSVDASGPAAGNIDVGDRLLALSARSTASTGWTAHWDTAGSAPSTG